jgi:hypothetical protein
MPLRSTYCCRSFSFSQCFQDFDGETTVNSMPVLKGLKQSCSHDLTNRLQTVVQTFGLFYTSS